MFCKLIVLITNLVLVNLSRFMNYLICHPLRHIWFSCSGLYSSEGTLCLPYHWWTQSRAPVRQYRSTEHHVERRTNQVFGGYTSIQPWIPTYNDCTLIYLHFLAVFIEDQPSRVLALRQISSFGLLLSLIGCLSHKP